MLKQEQGRLVRPVQVIEHQHDGSASRDGGEERRDAIEEYDKAGRSDRAQAERDELQILQEFLPARLTEAELEELARAAIAQSGAQSGKDMGNVMKVLMPQLSGRADGKAAGAAVKKLLG